MKTREKIALGPKPIEKTRIKCHLIAILAVKTRDICKAISLNCPFDLVFHVQDEALQFQISFFSRFLSCKSALGLTPPKPPKPPPPSSQDDRFRRVFRVVKKWYQGLAILTKGPVL